MTQKRIHYFDLAKGIGIILVVIGHLESISLPMRHFIVSFHMPLFFIISGMLLQITKEESKDMKTVLKKKFRHMMVPYISFSILYFFIDVIHFLLTAKGSWSAIWDNVYYCVCLYGVSTLWFLPAIFFGEIMFLFIRKHFSLAATVGIILALNILMYFANNGEQYLYALYSETLLYSYLHYFFAMFLRCFFSMAFIAIGYCISWCIKDRNVSPLWESLLGILFLGITVYVSQINGVVDLHFLVFNNIFLYFTTSVLGSLGVISLCRSLEGFSSVIPFRIIEYYGRNSLTVMATHINFYILRISLFIPMYFQSTAAHKNFFFYAGILVQVFLLEYFIIEIINRFFPFLLGRPLLKDSKS